MFRNFRTLFLAVGLTVALPAFGQATRTWVSGVGDDTNPCSRTAPCKTFAGAFSKTAAGGEIDALDPGGFGVVTITKSITIDGSAGNVGSILASGTNGVNIAAGNTDTVVLRNLSINGAGSTIGNNGINISSAGSVHIENTKVLQFSQNGINVGGTGVSVTVTDTQIDQITGNGVNVSGSGDTVLLENTRIFQTGTAIAASDGTTVNARNVDIATATSGAVATSSSTSVTLSVDTSVITGTTTAVQANGANATVAVNNSTFNNNGTAFGAGGGTVGSFGNNRVKPGNGSVGTITITYVPR